MSTATLNPLETALVLAKSGLSVILIRADESKASAIAWKGYQERIPTEAEIRIMFRDGCGLAIVGGKASGNLEILDIEKNARFAEFCELVNEHAPELLDILPHVETPSGGHHLFYRCDQIEGNLKLAMHPGADGKPEVIFETRGRGGYVLTISSPPACHEDHREYQLVKNRLTRIPRITPEQRSLLLNVARSFNEIRKEKGSHSAPSNGNGTRPGDIFADRTSWPEILEPHGWVCVGQQGEEYSWRPPGKSAGPSATTNYQGSDLLYVFSTNAAPFEHETSYSKFYAYAQLEHGGDARTAARVLAQRFEMSPKNGGNHGGESAPLPVDSVPGVEPTTEEGGPVPVLVRLSDVEPEEVEWYWKARLAKGKLTLYIGDPGLGKSTITLDAACRISTGSPWPDRAPAPTGSTILLSAEDGIADTIRRRVDILGGDPSKIQVLTAIRDRDIERPFSLVVDIPQLERALANVGDVRLVVVDPISAYLGSKDSHKDSEIRGVLSPLATLAEKYGVAVIGILHLTKNGQQKALLRALGSVAFVAAARTVFAVGQDPDDPGKRVLVGVKNNLAAEPDALAFRIIEDGSLVWEGAVDGADAETILSSGGTKGERTERNEAKDFLTDLLRDGPIQAKEAQKAARSNGISESTLKRAKSDLNIGSERVDGIGADGRWAWVHPKGSNEAPKKPTKGLSEERVVPLVQANETKPISSDTSTKGLTFPHVSALDERLRGKSLPGEPSSADQREGLEDTKWEGEL